MFIFVFAGMIRSSFRSNIQSLFLVGHHVVIMKENVFDCIPLDNVMDVIVN